MEKKPTPEQIELDDRLSIITPISIFVSNDVISESKLSWDNRFTDVVSRYLHNNYLLFIDGVTPNILEAPISEYRELLELYSALDEELKKTPVKDEQVTAMKEDVQRMIAVSPVISAYRELFSTTLSTLQVLYSLIPAFFGKTVRELNNDDFSLLSPVVMVLTKEDVGYYRLTENQRNQYFEIIPSVLSDFEATLRARIGGYDGENFAQAIGVLEDLIEFKGGSF